MTNSYRLSGLDEHQTIVRDVLAAGTFGGDYEQAPAAKRSNTDSAAGSSWAQLLAMASCTGLRTGTNRSPAWA